MEDLHPNRPNTRPRKDDWKQDKTPLAGAVRKGEKTEKRSWYERRSCCPTGIAVGSTRWITLRPLDKKQTDPPLTGAVRLGVWNVFGQHLSVEEYGHETTERKRRRT